ncbi:MAG: MBL fold metallo-hydrolase [Microcystaceae cyanobacterium]
MRLTWFDSNSWLIEVNEQRILLDPWLVGSLIFGDAPWLFKGDKNRSYPIPDRLSLILLSQGLADHSHPETLEKLDHTLPVLGSVNAAPVVKKIGFTNVTAIAPGESFILNEALEIRAFAGYPVGPTTIENAYLITDLKTGYKLYYEPHGFHSAEIKKIGSVDVVLTPIVGASLLHLIPILQGQKTSLELCQRLQPKIIIPTSAAADIQYTGIVGKIFREEGAIADFRQLLKEAQLSTEVLTPQPGEPLELAVYQKIGLNS